MNDHELLLAIQEILDGMEWGSGTFTEIANLLDANGYTIRDIDT